MEDLVDYVMRYLFAFVVPVVALIVALVVWYWDLIVVCGRLLRRLINRMAGNSG